MKMFDPIQNYLLRKAPAVWWTGLKQTLVIPIFLMVLFLLIINAIGGIPFRDVKLIDDEAIGFISIAFLFIMTMLLAGKGMMTNFPRFEIKLQTQFFAYVLIVLISSFLLLQYGLYRTSGSGAHRALVEAYNSEWGYDEATQSIPMGEAQRKIEELLQEDAATRKSYLSGLGLKGTELEVGDMTDNDYRESAIAYVGNEVSSYLTSLNLRSNFDYYFLHPYAKHSAHWLAAWFIYFPFAMVVINMWLAGKVISSGDDVLAMLVFSASPIFPTLLMVDAIWLASFIPLAIGYALCLSKKEGELGVRKWGHIFFGMLILFLACYFSYHYLYKITGKPIISLVLPAVIIFRYGTPFFIPVFSYPGRGAVIKLTDIYARRRGEW